MPGPRGYQARRDATGAAVLPRLVLVVDEFRALASELPDFLEGIVVSPPWAVPWECTWSWPPSVRAAW